MSDAGKFTAHGSVKPDAIMLTEHTEKPHLRLFNFLIIPFFGSSVEKKEIA